MAESRLGFWSNLAGLIAAVTTLLGFGTGTITVTGERFWSSPLLVSLLSLMGIVLLTASIDYLILDWLKKRLATRNFQLVAGDMPPGALIILSYVFWMPLYCLWFAAVVALNSVVFMGPKENGAGLAVISILLLPGGGIAIAFAVYELDKLFSPWMYRSD